MTASAPLSVLILHNSVTAESPADARDILAQVDCVADALRSLGHGVTTLPTGLALDDTQAELRARAPQVVFNLVEAIDDSGQLVPLATALLEHMGIPYTGGDTEAMILTSSKILTKRWLRAFGLPTPDWWDPSGPPLARVPEGAWIVKPLWEDASIGMDDASVVADFASVPARLAEKQQARPGPWFAERFIDGREINVAVLAGPAGAEVLPVAEIEFVDFPAGKPRIVGYAAKWFDDSFESRNTPRRFLDRASEADLSARIQEMALDCWRIFRLRGYARVDFRVDGAGQPWILEVNVNPCISPDAGFAAALAEAGISYAEGIGRILADALRGPASRSRPGEGG